MSWNLYLRFQFRHSYATDVPHTVRAEHLLFLSSGTKLTELNRSISLQLNTECNQMVRSRCTPYLVLTNNLVSFFSVIHSNIILSLTYTSTILYCIIELTDARHELTYFVQSCVQGVSLIVSANTASLWHRKHAFAQTSCDSCPVWGNDKINAVKFDKLRAL